MNPPATLDRRSLIISVLMIFIMVVVAGGMAVYVLSDPGIADARQMVLTAEAILDQYPESFNTEQAFDGARREMFDQLDRFSNYMSRNAVHAMDEELSGGYAGIGITIIEHEAGLLVLAVKDGGPADSAGLLLGDVIIQADSVNLSAVSSPRAAAHLRGDEGTTVDLRVWRNAVDDTLDITVTRSRIEFEHLVYSGRLHDGIIYARLRDFESGASRELEAAFDSLLAGTDLAGVVLDLRDNGGGLLAEGLDVAELFLPPNSFIVGTRGRSRWDNREFHARENNPTDSLPIAILVNDNTASASEIVSGALRFNDRAILVGDTTFGKGLVQGHFRFMDGDGLRLTISRYYFEGGVFLNEFDSALNEVGAGLVPDHYQQTKDLSPFLIKLENSFLLLQFGSTHAEEIAASISDGRLDPVWLDVFHRHCVDKGFEFTSETTRDADMLKQIATLTESSKHILNSADSIAELSRRLDREQFYLHGSYIARRLMEVAVQTQRGSHAAYRDVILPNDTLVETAIELLVRHKEPAG